MHWGTSIRLQVETWPHVVTIGLFVIGVLFLQFNLMEFCLTFLTRSRHLFLAKGLQSCDNLANKRGFRCSQWSCSAGSICSVDGWLFWAARQPFNPRTKNCGTLEVSFLVAFDWWALSNWNIFSLRHRWTHECSVFLEAFFDFQDMKQSCWWHVSVWNDTDDFERWPGCSNRCSWCMRSSDSCPHLKWSSFRRKASCKSKHFWIVSAFVRFALRASRLGRDMNPWRLQERILGGQFPSWATRQDKDRLELIPFMVNSLLRCWGYFFTCWVFFLCLNLWKGTYEMCRNERVVRQKLRSLIWSLLLQLQLLSLYLILSLYFHIFLSLKILKFGRPSRGARSDETESSGSVQQFWVLQGWWTKGSSFAFRCQLSQLSTFKDGVGLANSFVPLGGHRHTSAAQWCSVTRLQKFVVFKSSFACFFCVKGSLFGVVFKCQPFLKQG